MEVRSFLFLLLLVNIALSLFLVASDLSFSVVQWNTRGITNKIDDLMETFGNNRPDILVFQETNLKKDIYFDIDNYQVHRFGERKNNKEGNGKGLLIAVKNEHIGWVVNKVDNVHAQLLTLEIYILKKYKVFISNIYRKTKSYTEQEGVNFWNMIASPIDSHILLGDFNAHHVLWGDSKVDQVGNKIFEGILEGNYILHNNGATTFRGDKEDTRETAVDLTISKGNICRNISWELMDLHGSDHFPIMSKWGRKVDKTKTEENETNTEKFNFNTNKANWDSFHNKCDNTNWVEINDEDVEAYRKLIIDNITEICKETIPHKNIVNKNTKKYRSVPWWNKEINDLKTERDKLFKSFRNEQRVLERELIFTEYKRIRNKLGNLIKKSKFLFKINTIENINMNTKESELWGKIKEYEGKKGKCKGMSPLLNKENKLISNNAEKANLLADHYSNISSQTSYSDRFKKIKNNHEIKYAAELKKKGNDLEIYNQPITLKELKSTLNKKHNSAPGGDSISYTIFKNLPETALETIVNFFNKIWNSGKIPQSFKHAIVVPIPKPEKDPKQANSYRPIALTDHLGKLLESIITNRLNYVLETRGIITKEQSGFREKRQTLDHLARLINEVEKCRKYNRQTAAVFIDLQKAYDTIWREGAISELHKAGVTGQMFNYVLDFLKNRTFQVRIENSLSDTHTQEIGVPQGSVLSPTIFNLIINKVTKLQNKYIETALGQFADDIAMWLKAGAAPKRLFTKKARINHNLSINKVIEKINRPITKLIADLEDNGFKVNVTKTQSIFFDSKNLPNMTINNQQIRATTSVRYLGIILDRNLNFGLHIKNLVKKGIKALNIMSYMSGTKWGLKTKHLIMLYRNYVLPKFTYGEELFDLAPKSILKKLDYVQNQALRIITKTLKPTKTILLSILAGIEPLYIRRIKKKVQFYTRIIHNKNNPTNDIYKKIKPKINKTNRLGKRDTLVDSTFRHLETCNIDFNDIATKPDPYPIWSQNNLDIDIYLSSIFNKKETSPTEMKNVTENRIKHKYKSTELIFTDASKEHDRVGIGIYSEENNVNIALRTNNYISITTGELVAIEKVMQHILDNQNIHKNKRITILTDSLGACKAIDGDIKRGARTDILTNIHKLHKTLTVNGYSITLVWIPSHVDIEGNENADKLANIGRRSKNIDINIKLGYKELKSKINNMINEKIYNKNYQNDKSQSVAKFRRLISNINTKVDLKNYQLNRLRVRATNINLPGQEIYCRKCKCKLDLKHVTKYCTFFKKERDVIKRLLEKENKKFSMTDILKIDHTIQINKEISKLLNAINRIFKI